MKRTITEVLDHINYGVLDWDDVDYLQEHKDEAIKSGNLKAMEFAGVDRDTIRKVMRGK